MLSLRWNKYREIEIQAIVTHLFKMQGYKVRNQHLTDRSREKGADLIISKTGESEKIAVQVKKKPTSDDIRQLHQLAERTEEIKKYVYVEEPSTDFLERLNALSKTIDFWDGEKLIKEILNADPYLALLLLISDTKTARYLSMIQCILLDIYDRTKGKKLEDITLSSPTKELFHLLWQAKDRSVSLGKGLLTVGNFVDQTDRTSPALKIKDLEYIANSFAYLINGFRTQEVRALHDFFEEIINRYSGYLEYAAIERRIGTEWLYIMNFWFLVPGTVEKTLHAWEKEEEKWKDLLQGKTNKTREGDYDVFLAITHLSKNVAQFGMGLEGIIDDMYRYTLENEFDKSCNSF